MSSVTPHRKEGRKTAVAGITPHVNATNATNANKRKVVVNQLDEDKVNRVVKALLQPQYVFGSMATSIDPINSLTLTTNDKDSNDRIVYKAG